MELTQVSIVSAYHQQLHELELDRAWQRVSGPLVLVLHGEHDWVVSRDEQLRIVDIVGGSRPGAAQLIDLKGLDHMMGWHASHADSMSNYGSGIFEPTIRTETLEWMTSAPLQSAHE